MKSLLRSTTVRSLLIAALLASATTALAQTPAPTAANDGRSLAGESAATQAMFAAVWGPNAGAEWVREHNAQLAHLPIPPSPFVAVASAAPAAPPAAAPSGPTPTPTLAPVVPADTTSEPITKIAIPPIAGKTGSFDIFEVDQATHRLYVTDRTDTGIDVFDVSTPNAQYLSTIDVGSGPNGVVVAKNVNKVFAGLNNSDLVAIDIAPGSPTFDTVVARINTGGKARADELDYDPADQKIYVANSDDGIVTVVDATSDTMIKQFTDLGPGLEQPRYDPANGLMFMTSSEQNAVFVFDPRSDTLQTTWTVGDPCNPNGLAINPATNQGLLGCSNRAQPQHTTILDMNTGSVVATFNNVGAGDGAIYNAAADRFLFAASNFFRGPMVGVFAGSPTAKFLTNIPTATGAHGVAYDETNRMIYLPDQSPNAGGIIAVSLPQ